MRDQTSSPLPWFILLSLIPLYHSNCGTSRPLPLGSGYHFCDYPYRGQPRRLYYVGTPVFRDDGLPDCSKYCSQRYESLGTSRILVYHFTTSTRSVPTSHIVPFSRPVPEYQYSHPHEVLQTRSHSPQYVRSAPDESHIVYSQPVLQHQDSYPVYRRVYVKPSGCRYGNQHIAYGSSFKQSPCITCQCQRAGLYGRLSCQSDVRCMGQLRSWKEGHVRRYGLQEQGCRYKRSFIPFGREAAVSKCQSCKCLGNAQTAHLKCRVDMACSRGGCMYKGILIPHQHSVSVGCKKCACITHHARSIMFCKDDMLCKRRELKVEIEHIHSNSSSTVVKGKGDDENEFEKGTDYDSEDDSYDSQDKNKSSGDDDDNKKHSENDNSEKGKVIRKDKTSDTSTNTKNKGNSKHPPEKETKNKTDVKSAGNKTETDDKKESSSSKETKNTNTESEVVKSQDKNRRSKNNKTKDKEESHAKANVKEKESVNKSEDSKDTSSSSESTKNLDSLINKKKEVHESKEVNISNKTEDAITLSNKESKQTLTENINTVSANTSKSSGKNVAKHSNDKKHEKSDEYIEENSKSQTSKNVDVAASTKVEKSTKDDNSARDHKLAIDKQSTIDEKSAKDAKSTNDDKSTKDNKSIIDEATKDKKNGDKKSTIDEKPAKDAKSTNDDKSTKDNRTIKDEATKDKKEVSEKDRSSLVSEIVEKAKISMGKTKDKSTCQKSTSESAPQPERMCFYKSKSYKNGDVMKLKSCVSCVCTVAEKVEFKCSQDKECVQGLIPTPKTTNVHEEKCYYRNKAYSVGKGFYIKERKCTCTRLLTGLIFRCLSGASKPNKNVIHDGKDSVKTLEKKKFDDENNGDHNKENVQKEETNHKHGATFVEEVSLSPGEEGLGETNIENDTERPTDHYSVSSNEADEPDDTDDDDKDEAIKEVIRDIVQKSAQDEITISTTKKRQNEKHSKITKKTHDESDIKVRDDSSHTHTTKVNSSPTKIVYNIRRSTEGCYMGNHFVKYSHAIERPCSSCLCTKNPDQVFFCKARRHAACQTSGPKCLFENKTYDITDSINQGCNRCVCDSDHSFKPVIKCFKDPFCVEEGREFCWHNGRKIPLGLVFSHNKCKECACLLYQGSPSVQCKENKSCSHIDNKTSNPTKTSTKKESFSNDNHMTAIKTKQCLVDGKIIPLLQGITVGNCKTCVCLNVGNNVGFYCKKTPGCVDEFNQHEQKTVDIKGRRIIEDGSLKRHWETSGHHCHLNDRRIPAGSRVRIEYCTVCRCLTDSQESAYLSCHYHPSCASWRSNHDQSHYKHTSHDHNTISQENKHPDVKPKQHEHEHETMVISGCRRKNRVISFGADLKMGKCKVCTCKQLPSGPVFVCRNACKDSPIISSSVTSRKQHVEVSGRHHSHHNPAPQKQHKPPKRVNRKVIKPRTPSCVYQDKATPLGKSRRIPGNLTCTCIKQKSGSLVFSCTKEEGRGSRASEERRKKKEQLLKYLRHERMSNLENTMTKQSLEQSHHRHDESRTEAERKRRKIKRRQVLEFMRHQVLLRNGDQMTSNLKKATSEKLKHQHEKIIDAQKTSRSQFKWRNVRSHHRPIPKQYRHQNRHQKFASVDRSKLFSQPVDRENYRCHNMQAGDVVFGTDDKSSGCFYEGVVIPAGYSIFINRHIKCKCESTSTNDQLVCRYDQHDQHPQHSHSGVHSGVQISGCVVGGVVVSSGGVILTGKCRYCRCSLSGEGHENYTLSCHRQSEGECSAANRAPVHLPPTVYHDKSFRQGCPITYKMVIQHNSKLYNRQHCETCTCNRGALRCSNLHPKHCASSNRSGCFMGMYYLTPGSHLMRGCRTCTCKHDNTLMCTVDKHCVGHNA
ncbi:hypothetical protein ACHWQZ_G018042 [Mnemiopsis leidyi]